MRYSRPAHYQHRGMALAIMVVFLSGCIGPTSYVGQTARQENQVVLLAGGPHEGLWETNDVILNYAYTNNSSALGIKGTVKLSQGLTTGYKAVEGFRVRINFLDQEKTILDSQILYMGGHRAPILTWSYDRTYPLPADTVAFNISYAGTALDLSGSTVRDKGGDGVSWDFWRRP